MQSKNELDAFYKEADPWNYDSTPDDLARIERLLFELPARTYERVLDIGCGNGFVTERLPGQQITGCDISDRAVDWARRRVSVREDAHRFEFVQANIFDIAHRVTGPFDLIVITGVLYPQYIGKGFSVVREAVDALLRPGGVVASVHIDDWCNWRFPYTMLSCDLSPYRQYMHRIEVFLK